MNYEILESAIKSMGFMYAIHEEQSMWEDFSIYEVQVIDNLVNIMIEGLEIGNCDKKDNLINDLKGYISFNDFKEKPVNEIMTILLDYRFYEMHKHENKKSYAKIMDEEHFLPIQKKSVAPF